MADEEDELSKAVKEGDVEKIQRWADDVGRQTLIKKQDEYGNSLLHDAARFGHLEVVKLLVEWKAGVNQKNKFGFTALHWAAKSNNPEIVSYLLDHGAEINIKSKDGKTPLHAAVETEIHMNIVRIFVEKGADLNAVNNAQVSALHIAASKGHYECCSLLLDSRSGARKADVKTLNKSGENALFSIIRFGVNFKKPESVVQREVQDAIKIVKLLLSENVDLDCTNKEGHTPLTLLRDKISRATKGRMKGHYSEIERLLVEEKKEKDRSVLMREPGVSVKSVKLYICGHGGVGKTTLKESLQKEWSWFRRPHKSTAPCPGKDKHTPTAGIDVCTTNIPHAGLFSLWDFAGQSEFYVTHNMVLNAENATFLLMYKIVDCTKSINGEVTEVIPPLKAKEDQKQKVFYWLRFIRATNSSSGDGDSESSESDRRPTVILVASRADWVADEYKAEANKVANEILAEAKETFSDSLNVWDETFVLNCHLSQDKDMGKVRDVLKSRREVILQREKAMPKICDEILKEKDSWALDVNFPVLSWQDYTARGKKLARGIEEDLLEKATSYLHNIGEVIHVKSSKLAESQDVVVLNPQWFCNKLIGPFLATDFLFHQYPRRLLPKEKHSRQEIESVLDGCCADLNVVLRLLEEFEILFPLDAESTEYMIPSLLEETMPPGQWQESRIKRRYYGRRFACGSKCDSFSPGFFPRLQTRLHKHLTRLNRRPSSVWRNGIKICYRVEGMVYMTREREALHVCVRAEKEEEVRECYKLLELMTADVFDVLQLSCPGIDVEMSILSAESLREHYNPERFRYYSLQKVLDADDSDGYVYDEQIIVEEKVVNLLCAGYDRTFLRAKGGQCDVRWMLRETRQKFSLLMDVEAPINNDVRLMADYMGFNYEDMQLLKQQAVNSNRSVTDVLLDAWSQRWTERRAEAIRKGEPPLHLEEGSNNPLYYESSVENLQKIVSDPGMTRDDARDILDNMFKILESIPDVPDEEEGEETASDSSSFTVHEQMKTDENEQSIPSEEMDKLYLQ